MLPRWLCVTIDRPIVYGFFFFSGREKKLNFNFLITTGSVFCFFFPKTFFSFCFVHVDIIHVRLKAYIPRQELKKKTIITFCLNFLTKLNKLLYLTFNSTNYFYTPHISTFIFRAYKRSLQYF